MRGKAYFLLALFSLVFLGASLACATEMPTVPPALTSTEALSIEPSRVKTVRQKHYFNLNQIFQFDRSPLGKRLPVVLVPGRAEEFQRNSWWKAFYQLSRRSTAFNQHFKLYAFIYNSKVELDEQAQDFQVELRKHFGYLPAQQPLMLVTYSLGGVITREAMADTELLNKTDTIIAIAVPFHGSPLFDPDWFSKYMRPPYRAPLRTFWDQVIYRAYMFDKNNLTRGLRWDNFDGSKPQFEPNKINIAGDQIIPQISPYERYPQEEAMRKKMLVYASYMENGYTNSNQPLNPRKLPHYVLKNSVKLPKELIARVSPFYGFTVHSVFTYMNHQLSNIPTYTPEDPQGKNTHLYRFNDGAIPLSSMLFLPATANPYERDVYEMVKQSDCRHVRIFVNLDHMHIGEYGLLKSKLVRPDIFHPEDGERSPNQWIIHDLLHRVQQTTALSNQQS